MTTLDQIDRVVEIDRDADIDALMDDKKLLPFELTPDIYGLADALADLRDTYRLPHMISTHRERANGR